MERVSFIILTGLFTILLLFVSWWITPWQSSSMATSVRRLTLAELREQAESVIVGVVTSISTRTSSEGKMVWTDYEIAVQETLAGQERESPTVVSFAGGQYGSSSIGVVGIPQLEQGERYVLFLLPENNFVSATVGWGQGIFRSVDIDANSDSQTVLISYDGEPLQVNPQEQLFRGSPVKVQNESLVPLPSRRLSTPEDVSEMDPIVYDAKGNVIPQPPSESESNVAAVAERHFATIDDVRSFLNTKNKENNAAEDSG